MQVGPPEEDDEDAWETDLASETEDTTEEPEEGPEFLEEKQESAPEKTKSSFKKQLHKNFKKKCQVMMLESSYVSANESILPIITATAIEPDGKVKNLRILLDTASTASFIKVGPNSLQNYDVLEPNLTLNINHIEGSSKNKSTNLVSFKLVAPDNRVFPFTAYTTTKILKLPKPHVDEKKLMQLKEKFGKDLSLVKEACEIDILLGTGDTMRVIEKVIKFNDLFIVKTPWGFTPCGNFTTENSTTCLATNLDELNKTLEKMWRIDEMPFDKKSGLTREEHLAVEKIEQNLRFNEERGRFETALLFKQEPLLSNNYDRALARFSSLQRSLQRNDELKQAYCKAMQEFIDNKVVELVEDEAAEEKGRNDLFYLPHRAVYDPNRISTQCRVVFDASAKTSTGHSLNSFLSSGPPLQLDITALAMRFRLRKIVLIGDISKMFLNIDVKEKDRDFLRFLWKNPGEKGKPRIYRFSTLIFGATDSPFQAITCLQKLVANKLAEPEITELEKRACDVILRDTYVDDITTGGETVQETLELMQGVQTLLNQAHFFVKKWKTNSPELLKNIPESDRAPVKDSLLIDEQDDSKIISDNSKMLGLSWDPENDIIFFNHEMISKENDDTKTAVASLLAKIYDPLGLVSPFVLQARQVLKKTHQAKLGWKQKLPVDLVPEWHQWVEQIQNLSTLKFERYIYTDENSELHVFSDASIHGYGAAAYVRNLSKDGYNSTLLIARSKIAPIKEHTIPRLELIAALLAANLAHEICNELKLSKSKVFCWTDSEIVLYWLQKKPDTLIPFIANRIEKIQQHSFPFAYVNTSENPADIASRGCNAIDLNAPLWLKGPEFLEQANKEWPTQKIDLSQIDERQGVKKKHVFNFSNLTLKIKRENGNFDDIPLELYCSTYEKLIRRTANLFKIFDFWRNKINPKIAILDYATYEAKALKLWIKLVQAAAFAPEISALLRQKNLPVKSNIRALTPWLDNDNLLRVGGRLAYANVTQETKHPIILPKDHKFTLLLVKHAHETNMHMGTDWVHHHLRQKFWIISSRQLIKATLKRCLVCDKLQGKRGEQQMAQLPVPRVQQQVPFSHVGVDYTGNLYLRNDRKNSPAYIVVFTCLTTRAVHLEVVKTGQINDFVDALKRMISSKGTPTDIYSDNALIFKTLKDRLEKGDLNLNTLLPGGKWHLSTEAAPHTGGVWERIVGLVKKPLSKIIGRQVLDYDEMITICKEVEGILNDRPLAEVSADSMEVITPSMLTIGRKIRACPMPEPNQPPTPRVNVKKQMTERDRLVARFWKSWLDEYCLSLQKMHKWDQKRPNISIGDLVLVERRPLNRSHWPLARIQEIFPSRDGLVRKVKLILPATSENPNGRLIIRSIHNIFPLELTRDSDNDNDSDNDSDNENFAQLNDDDDSEPFIEEHADE